MAGIVACQLTKQIQISETDRQNKQELIKAKLFSTLPGNGNDPNPDVLFFELAVEGTCSPQS